MDANAKKLAVKLGDVDLAAALVQAGLDNPAKLRNASNEELEGIKGIGPATRKAIREKFVKRG